MSISLFFTRRTGHRIATDTTVIESHFVERGDIFRGAVLFDQRVTFGFVLETKDAPLFGPVVAVGARQGLDDHFDILALDPLKGVDARGTTQNLLLDLLQCALLRTDRRDIQHQNTHRKQYSTAQQRNSCITCPPQLRPVLLLCGQIKLQFIPTGYPFTVAPPRGRSESPGTPYIRYQENGRNRGYP